MSLFFFQSLDFLEEVRKHKNDNDEFRSDEPILNLYKKNNVACAMHTAEIVN